ncbi:MAG TPA: MG2 domain-containing protein, partial [Gemmatimonadaceae bacterium]|nr:MG2 domain-containing protein [Gemmatimonadaceae bacterium]
MRRHRFSISKLVAMVGVAALWATAAGAQDSVRVLRFQPDSAAPPVSPVVITFDRPVAPKLDESIEPESVLTITPARAHRTYWRDPSTLVAEFDAAWPHGASYEVRLAPTLRATGRPFARRAPWRVRIQSPRVIAVLPAGAPYEETGEVDTRAHLYIVWSGAVPPATLANRLWFVPTTEQCSGRDSVPLTVVSTRRITAADPYSLTYAGGYDRDQRLDSLRRVVEVRATSAVPRGCVGALRTPAIGTTPVQAHQVRIVPRFVVASVHTRDWDGNDSCVGSRCEAGPIIVSFSQLVTRAEVVEHVRIDGRPAHVPSNSEARDWILDDRLHAGVTTRIAIDASIVSRYGERLASSIDTVLVGRQSKPALGIATGQVVLPARTPYLLRVRYASTDSVRVIIGRVADSLRSRALTYGSRPYDRIGWSRVVADSVVHVVVTRFDSLRERVLDIPPAWVPERGRGDPLLLVRAVPIKAMPQAPRPRTGATVLPGVVTVAEGYDRREPRFAVVQHSDLVAHAARHGDEVEVWVTRRASAEPVRGARVALFGLRGRPLGAATTDTLGVAHVTGIAHRTTQEALALPHLEVTHGGDRVLLALSPDPVFDDRDVRGGAESDSAPVASAVRGVLHGAVFSDRAIYRPGERVYVKGIARNFRPGTGYAVPAGDSVRWTLAFEQEGSRETIVTRTGRLGDFGTHSDSLELPSTARVGWYRAAFEVRDRYGWRDAAQTQVSIAEYRVPEFAVRAAVDTSVPVFAGDSATVRVDANYLFGPPMAHAVVKTTVSTSDQYGWAPSFPSLKGYQVGRSYWLDEERPQVQEAQPAPMKLGADGSLVMRLPSRAITRPGLMSISVSVEDASRQAIAANTYVSIRAADAYVGMRTTSERWDWPAGKPISIELLAVGGNGVPRAGTVIRLAAHRITWSGARWKRDTTWRDSVTSGEQAVRASFMPTVDGWYEIIASIRDEHGRVAESGLHLGVMGANSGWPGGRSVLALKLDDREVNAGDTLDAIIEAPADLRAWVSVRNGGTPWQQLMTLKRGLNVLRVPVPQGGARMAQLHVVAVRAVSATSSTSPSDLPYFFHENTIFWVNDSSRVLRVGISADRARYQPGDTVRVAVSVTNHQGRARKSELAVWAVDEGVVSLTGFRRPSLIETLLRGRYEYWWLASTLLGTLLSGPPGLGPLSFDEYADFSGQGLYERADARRARPTLSYLTAATASGGSIPTPNDSSLRHRFVTTPFFAGAVTTD